MRDYELILVLDPKLGEAGASGLLEMVSGLVQKGGGQVVGQEQWGMRKLSYPINRLKEGNFVLTNLSLGEAQVKALDDSLRVSEGVLRHLLVRKGT